MWFLYVDGRFVCQSDDTSHLLALLDELMLCTGFDRIELRREKEF